MDIRDITEEKIFQTLGKGVPICDLLTEANVNTIKSNAVLEQAIKQIPEKGKEKIPDLEVVLARQKLNLDSIKDVKKELGCK